jgi:HlyD family secretion protein
MTTPRHPLLALLLAAACSSAGADPFEARGTVEVPEVDISALSSARVVAVRVEEGARVEAGDTLAALTQVDLDASIAAERARVATALANLRDLEAGSRPEEIARARAELGAARAEVDRTSKDLERIRDLVSREVASREALDHAVSAEQVARGRMQAAEEALRLLQAGSRREQVAGARGALAGARAALAQIEARATDLVLTAPVGGIVLSRNAEPGEALGAGVPVLTLGEMARPFVRVYLPQSVVSGLALGAAVEVVTGDGRLLPGRVVAINPRAEFTPRVALTESERADLMFGVKVEFDDPASAPYPGLWVTVRVDAKTQRRKDATQ